MVGFARPQLVREVFFSRWVFVHGGLFGDVVELFGLKKTQSHKRLNYRKLRIFEITQQSSKIILFVNVVKRLICFICYFIPDGHFLPVSSMFEVRMQHPSNPSHHTHKCPRLHYNISNTINDYRWKHMRMKGARIFVYYP